jgi:uncharacterized protein (DUF779 family)
MFHQSGGCCDGSAPMCYPDGEVLTGEADVHLGDLEVGLDRAVPFWMSKAQFGYWSHTHLTVDVVPGRGSGFSVEAPEGVRFLIRSRLFTDEAHALAIANGTKYGLHGCVWSADQDRAIAFARQVRTGQIDINGAAYNSRAPFGGYKQSGIGREQGVVAMDEFLETKSIQV